MTYTDNYIFITIHFPVTMRAAPSLSQTTGTNYYRVYSNGNSDSFNQFVQVHDVSKNCLLMSANNAGGVTGRTAGHAGFVITDNSSASISFSAEL